MSNIELSKGHLKRTADDWKRVAKEELKVKAIGNTIFAFGSELAILRLYYLYGGAKTVLAFENKGDQSEHGAGASVWT